MAVKTFSGGDKLQKRLQEILKQAQNSSAVRVGFLEGATYPDGTPVAAVAAYNEYGTQNAPPRPFFRGMIAKNKGEWGPQFAALMVKNNYDAHKALAYMGERIAGDLRQSIQEFTSPGLAKSTILARARGSKRGAIKSPTIAKPLIDTGHMLNSVDFEVKE